MKTNLGIVGVILLVCSISIKADELRTVDGKVVDLTPVRQWLQVRTGQRPLPDWKQILILDVKADTDGAPRCKVKMEDGNETEVRIRNLPPETRTLFWKKEQMAAHSEAMKRQSAARERALGQADVAAAASDLPINAADATAREATITKAKERIRNEGLYVDILRDQQNAIVAGGTNITTVLAIATGKKEGGLEVWDCGKPAPAK